MIAGVARSASVRLRLMAGTVLLLAAGCASTPPVDAPRSGANDASAAVPDSTAAQVRRIFRYQSRVADALLDRYPLREDFARADPRLVSAEARMTRKCGKVTRVVVDKLEGSEPSLLERWSMLRSLDSCERAARKVESLLGVDEEHAIASTRGT